MKLGRIVLPIVILMMFQTAYPLAHGARIGTGSGLDCNGYSRNPNYRNIALSPICADLPKGLEDNGHYVGHDEPRIHFFSDTTNSASNMQWRINLPAADPTPTQDGTSVASFENYAAFWFSLAICDPQSYPQGNCTSNSDTNTGDSGSALLELQLFPPGSNSWSRTSTVFCSTTQWCAALTIDSLECTSSFIFCNPNCMEPINFALIQTDGVPTGPPAPDSQTAFTFTPNAKTLMMNPGDDLLITINDTANGLLNKISDSTTGSSGFMTASSANGFGNSDIFSCATSPFDFHPEYNTAAQGNYVSWLTLNVAFSMEIGHFELGSTGDNDADDARCYTVDGISGCTGADTDFDGTSYLADWPDGSTSHPRSIIISSPSGTGVGPMSFDGTFYTGSYGTIQFKTNPTPTQIGTASFYPFYTQASTGLACRFNFGNDIPGITTSDFGKTAQYGQTPFQNPCPPMSVGTVYSLVSVVRGSDNIVYWNGFTGSWSGWQSLVGSTLNSTALCPSGPGRLELVVRGNDNQIWHKTFQHGSWGSSWDTPGGSTNDQPACTILGGVLYIAVRGADNGIYLNNQTLATGTWSGWMNMGGNTNSSPVIDASPGTNRLDLVVRGINNLIYHKFYAQGLWSKAWDSPGGLTPSAPSAVSDGAVLNLVVRGMDNRLWYNFFNFSLGTWSHWLSLGGTTPSAPALAISPPSTITATTTLNLVVRGSDNGIWHISKPLSGPWKTVWDSPGGSTMVTPGLTFVGSDLALFVRGGDQGVWYNTFDGAAWKGWLSLGGVTPSSPSGSVVT